MPLDAPTTTPTTQLHDRLAEIPQLENRRQFSAVTRNSRGLSRTSQFTRLMCVYLITLATTHRNQSLGFARRHLIRRAPAKITGKLSCALNSDERGRVCDARTRFHPASD